MSTYTCALSAAPSTLRIVVIRVVDMTLSFIAEKAWNTTSAFSIEVSERKDRCQLILMRARDTLVPHKHSCPMTPFASGPLLWTLFQFLRCRAHPDDPLVDHRCISVAAH